MCPKPTPVAWKRVTIFGQQRALEVLENVLKLGADIPSCIAINLFPVFTHDTIGALARMIIMT
jgi:hypothetical protein